MLTSLAYLVILISQGSCLPVFHSPFLQLLTTLISEQCEIPGVPEGLSCKTLNAGGQPCLAVSTSPAPNVPTAHPVFVDWVGMSEEVNPGCFPWRYLQSFMWTGAPITQRFQTHGRFLSAFSSTWKDPPFRLSTRHVGLEDWGHEVNC